jgi:hypothetical protein
VTVSLYAGFPIERFIIFPELYHGGENIANKVLADIIAKLTSVRAVDSYIIQLTWQVDMMTSSKHSCYIGIYSTCWTFSVVRYAAVDCCLVAEHFLLLCNKCTLPLCTQIILGS